MGDKNKLEIIRTVSHYNEWMKWLSYNSSSSDLELIEKFERYRSNFCPYEVKSAVESCLYSIPSLQELMISKLTLQELEYAKGEIEKLKNDSEGLKKRINDITDINLYSKLSMVDAFISFYVRQMSHGAFLIDIDEVISNHGKAM